MSKHFGVLSALLSALIAFAAVPAASVAAPRSAAVSVRPARAAVFGVRLFGRSPSLSSRYRYGYRSTRSP